MGKTTKNFLFLLAAVQLILLFFYLNDMGALAKGLSAQNIFVLIIFIGFNAGLAALFVYMNMREQVKRLKTLSNRDQLTGLFNASELRSMLNYDIARVKRYGGELSVIQMDLDDFNKLNQEFGKKSGDLVLSQVSDLLLEGVTYVYKEEKEYHGIRSSDIAFRRDNDDKIFIILPETPLRGAWITAERIREAILYTPFLSSRDDRPMHVTVSIAVVSYRQQKDSVDTLLKRSDLLMRKAKVTKNSVVMENPVNVENATPYDNEETAPQKA